MVGIFFFFLFFFSLVLVCGAVELLLVCFWGFVGGLFSLLLLKTVLEESIIPLI